MGGGHLWRRKRSRKSDNTALTGSQGSDSHSGTVSELSGVCEHLGCGSLRTVAAWRPLLLQEVQPRRHRGQLGHRGGRPLHLHAQINESRSSLLPGSNSDTQGRPPLLQGTTGCFTPKLFFYIWLHLVDLKILALKCLFFWNTLYILYLET